jgi:hypothetical protein
MTAADSRRHANATLMNDLLLFRVTELNVPLLEGIHAPNEFRAREPRISGICGILVEVPTG